MKGMTPVKGFSKDSCIKNDINYKNILETITPLTKIGIVIFIIGKIIGIITVPVVFIPTLQMFAVPLIVCWGTCVIVTIIICSYDHFKKPKQNYDNENKIEQIKKWIHDNPDLKDQIFLDEKKLKCKGFYDG